MIKNIVVLGHGAGIKFIVKSLLENPELGFRVSAVVTHPLIDHKADLDMLESKSEMYGEYGYNIFNINSDFNIDILESDDVNSCDTISWIKKYSPEYIISVSCRNIINSNFLNCFNRKVLNIHTTPLPRYRGGASDSWMILNGEWGKELFGCLHFVDEGIDTGDVISKSFYQVPNKCYPIDLYKIRLNTFKNILIDGLKKLSNRNFIPEKQDSNNATFFPRLNAKIDGRIDFFNQSGFEIERFIFAFGYPYDGAHCFFNELKINILEAEFIVDDTLHPKCIGLVYGKDSHGHYKVALKGGYILIKKISFNLEVINQSKIFRLGKFLN